MPTQAVIVAGGRGRRMGAAARNAPKAMLDIWGKPLLERQLEWLKSWGVVDVVACLGYKAEAVTRYFGDGSRWGLNLSYQIETRPRGTAGCVRDLGPRLQDDALIVYGDVYIDMDLKRFEAFHRAHKDAAATLVLRRTDHPLDSDLARVEGDFVAGFYRAQPGQPYDNLACAAVWAVRPALLGLIPSSGPSDFGRDIFPMALARGIKIAGYRTDEQLADLGTPERLENFIAQRAKA